MATDQPALGSRVYSVASSARRRTYCGYNPRVSNCRLHSAGASRSRSTPRPRNLILVFDLADIEVVAQQVVQRAATERDAAARLAGREPFDSGPDVAFFEVP